MLLGVALELLNFLLRTRKIAGSELGPANPLPCQGFVLVASLRQMTDITAFVNSLNFHLRFICYLFIVLPFDAA
jgi:hypothetical protein